MVEPKTGNLGEKREIWSENQKTQSTRVTPPRETFNFRITNMNFAGAHVIPKEHKKNLNFRLRTSAGVHVVRGGS